MNAHPGLISTLLAGTFFFSVTAHACPACDEEAQTATTSSEQEIQRLSVQEVQQQLQQNANAVVVLDANPLDVFREHHLPGAKRVEYDQLTAADLPTDKSTPVIIYCAEERCGASAIAAKQARALGWKQVSLMPQGIHGWIAAGLPTERSGDLNGEQDVCP